MLFKWFAKYPIAAIFFHILLGVLARYVPTAISTYFLLVICLGVAEVITQRDCNNLAGWYLFYIVGMEIVYRVAGATIFYELGKYACITIAIAGLLAKKKKQFPGAFIAYGLLLVPGIVIAGGVTDMSVTDFRKQLLFNLSGPLSLLFAGLYFFRRPIVLNDLHRMLRIAILPSVALVVLLFLGKKISEIDFSVQSNFDASGGFGPNQVSTALGWGIIILTYALLKRLPLTINRQTDLILLGLIAFRGLVTLSRGGMIGSVLAVILPVLVLLFFSSQMRRNIWSISRQLILALFLFIGVAYVANSLTDNILLYRYQGKNQREILTGFEDPKEEVPYLSGRELILQQEVEIFLDDAFLGIGVGQGAQYRFQKYGGMYHASHTELSRLLAEHGIFGLFIIVFIFVFYPIWYFFKHKDTNSRHWFLQFYILALFTMLHAGMRLAMPGVAFGLAFIHILSNHAIDPLHRQ